MVLFVLYEHAAGYAIFRCREVEDIGSLLPEVQEGISDFAKFGSTVSLEAFSPFKTGVNALENINCVSEGVMHDDLKVFIANNIAQGKKKSKIQLGVADPKLGSSIQETLNIQCTSGGVVSELQRGIRLYFPKLVSELTPLMTAKAQLGLGHSYSRAKVKFNVHRSDNMIIQAISLLDQLDKDINTFSMRIREWYSYHFPELVKIIPDNFLYAKVVRFIGSRKDLTEDKVEQLEELVMDSTKCEAIIEAARVSMGMDISPIDLINIERFASRVVELAEYRKELSGYLSSKMDAVAPNLTTLIGETVGARLISHAGSLTSLAKYPASTVQILGAEKALFRALKTKGNTPKYGLIFHSSFIGRAGSKNKGRISRYLANKCSIASRLDCFSEMPSTKFGEKLREQVEERLTFFETGQIPRKNVDVMKLAIDEIATERGNVTKEEAMEVDAATLSSKKKKKRKSMNKETGESLSNIEDIVTPLKKKSKKRSTDDDETAEAVEVVETPKSAKKKRKRNTEEVEETADTIDVIETPKSKKKKKKAKE